MAIIIKGNVQGDVISDGGVKNETHYHYSNRHVSNQDTEPSQELFLNFYEMQYNRFCEEWLSNRVRIIEILNEDISNKRKCNKFYALKDEVWKSLYESSFLDALKDGINIYDIHDYQKEHPDSNKTEDEIREVLALAELVDSENRPYKEKVGKYIFEHRKSLSYEDISTFFVYLDAVPDILSNIEKLKEENCDETVAPQPIANDSTSEVGQVNPIVDAIMEQTAQDNPSCPLNSTSPFTPAVIDTTKADAVIALLRQLMEGKTKPKDVLMPVRAAMDAGVIRRPTWEEFCQEFGSYRLKSKTSFSDYTNPDKSPYTGADFQMMKEKFRQLMSDGQ